MAACARVPVVRQSSRSGHFLRVFHRFFGNGDNRLRRAGRGWRYRHKAARLWSFIHNSASGIEATEKGDADFFDQQGDFVNGMVLARGNFSRLEKLKPLSYKWNTIVNQLGRLNVRRTPSKRLIANAFNAAIIGD